MLDRQGSHALSSLIHGVGVLIELLRRGTCSEEYEDQGPPPSEFGEAAALQASLPQRPMHHRNALHIAEVVAVLGGTLDRISVALRNPMVRITDRPSSIGKLEPVGQERLNLLELLAELVRTLDPVILSALQREHLLDVIVDLLFRYPWNNLVHMVVCDVVHTLTEAEVEVSLPLVGWLVTRCQVLVRICEAVRVNVEMCARPKGGFCVY